MNLTSDQWAYVLNVALADFMNKYTFMHIGFILPQVKLECMDDAMEHPDYRYWLNCLPTDLIRLALSRATPDEWTQISAMVLGQKENE